MGRAPLREGGRPSSPWSRTQDVICCQSAAPHCPLPELSLSLRLHLQRSRGRALQGADSPASQEGAGGDLVLVVPRQRTERSRGAGSLPSPTPGGSWSLGGVSLWLWPGDILGLAQTREGRALPGYRPASSAQVCDEDTEAWRREEACSLSLGEYGWPGPGGPAPGVQGLRDQPGLRDPVKPCVALGGWTGPRGKGGWGGQCGLARAGVVARRSKPFISCQQSRGAEVHQ